VLDVIVAAVGVLLIVGGVALVNVPAALIVAGVAILAVAFLFDLPAIRKGGAE
jgi:hypothetical protein